MDIKKIGPLIRKRRLEKGYGLNELARKLEITNTYLSNIERGLRNPSIETLSKIYKALDLPNESVWYMCDKNFNSSKIKQEIDEFNSLEKLISYCGYKIHICNSCSSSSLNPTEKELDKYEEDLNNGKIPAFLINDTEISLPQFNSFKDEIKDFIEFKINKMLKGK